MDILNLYEKYQSYFDGKVKAIFEKISKIASEENVKIYLIGGLVRDFLLNQKSLDIDITVEGSAIDFAKILEEKDIASTSSTHKDFGTVKIKIDGIDIDLASTRSEKYPKKGHLPKVKEIGCPLKEDVLRRDFTINSLALSLNQSNFLEIIDFTDGLKDLENKKIRILHDKSFVDDPTRIIRALKYSSRFGFSLDEQTKKLQENYLENINYDLGQKRILQEFKKTFSEQNPPYKEFINQKIYKLINPNDLKLLDLKNEKLPWIVYFGLIMPDDINNFQFKKSEKEILEGAKGLIDKSFNNDFEIHKAFCALLPESIKILEIRDNVYAKKYINELKKIKVLTSGKDLIKIGIKPSKKFGEIFDYILKEKLNSPNLTKSEELELIKNFY